MNKRQEHLRERILAYLQTHANHESNADSFELLWHAIQSHLQTKRDEIYDDIKYYPLPIPACDQQFNYLLEQRAKVAQELSEVNALLKQGCQPDDSIHQVEQFIRTSPFIDQALEDKIKAKFMRPDGTRVSRLTTYDSRLMTHDL